MALIQAACLLAFLCYAVLIALVARNIKRRKPARHFLLYLFGMLAWQSGQTLVAFTSSEDVAILGYRIIAVVAPLFGFAYVMFVRNLLDKQTHRFVAPFGYLVTSIAALAFALSPSTGILGVYQDDLPLFLPQIGIGPTLTGVMVYACLLYGLVLLIHARQVTSSPLQRTRLTYLMIGVPVVVIGSSLNYVPAWQIYPVDMASNVINALLIAFVILRYQLLDIHVVVGKGLRYSITTIIVSAIYFTLVSLSVQVFHFVSGYQVAVLSIVMGILAAVVVQPLRDGIQRRVDRQFFGERYDATQMLERLSSNAATLLDPDTLANMILTEVSDTLHIERGAYYLKNENGGYALVASSGVPSIAGSVLRPDHPVVLHLGSQRQVISAQTLEWLPRMRALRLEERTQWDALSPALLIPVVAKDALVGLLILGPKLSGIDYDADDHLTLMTVANQTAVSTENARLYADVQHQLAERQRAEARILESLHEKEVLLKEIHHRVKNNLQIVHSLLSLQGRQATDAATVEVLRDSQNRIRSMALIHERLYKSENLADIDFADYLPKLATHLHRSYAVNGRKVSVVVNRASVRLPLDLALPCALIASELISNALKHAFVGRNEGVVCIQMLQSSAGLVELEVSDDGIGMPQEIVANVSPPLGMQLIAGLVRQLEGTLTIERSAGARFTINFPAPVASSIPVAFPPVIPPPSG